MGDRAIIQFKADESTPSINLYTHWGGSKRYTDLADALEFARPRWSDPEYATRICISQIIGNDWNDEHGFGLSVGDENARHGDYTTVPCVIWNRLCVRIDAPDEPAGAHVHLEYSFDEFIERARARTAEQLAELRF